MPSDYAKIRAENIEEYGKGVRHLAFLGTLYTDRTHFIFELLQNAEDAGASSIQFNLCEDRLEVRHNGRPFNEADVRGVCGVGDGTKSEDLTQIGKFGIGFKSVYAYTAAPEVHSSSESFCIKNYVRPHPVEQRSLDASQTTLFVFNFDAKDIDPERSVSEIGYRLRSLNARTLLFLTHLSEIDYTLPDGTSGAYLREETSRDIARQITVVGQDQSQDAAETWLIYSRPVQVPDSNNRVHVEIAFQLQYRERGKEETVARITESPLVVYFSTEKDTRLGFLIQGAYKTTPGRDNIPKDDDWNATLVEETALLLGDVLPSLKRLGLLTVSLLESLPIRMDDFPTDSMFYPIAAAVRKELMNHALLPTNDGTFVSARNAKLARGASLIRLLNKDQLRPLFQSSTAINWLAKEITQANTRDLRTYLMTELEVEEVTPESFAREITPAFLESQPDEWIAALYGYLTSQEALWRPPRKYYEGGLLRCKPILRLQDGSHVAPFMPDEVTPSAFLPPTEETHFPTVKRSIVANEQAAEFLDQLGLAKPDVFDEIVETVFPRYTGMPDERIPQNEHQSNIRKILRAMSSDSEDGKRKIRSAAEGTPFLQAINQHGEIMLKPPDMIYADTPNLRRYFENCSNAWFLHEATAEYPLETGIWDDLGVAQLPRRMPFSGGLPEEDEERSTREETIRNYDLDGLQSFLSSLAILPADEQKPSSLVLWNFLEKHLNGNARLFKGRYEWFYRSKQTKSFDSRILSRVLDAQWIPTKYGELKSPGDITIGELPDECAGSHELIDALGIEEGVDQAPLTEEGRKRESADLLEISLENIEFLKRHFEEFEAWKKHISACTAVKPTFPAGNVKNPERRQERLIEQINAAPEKQYDHIPSSTRVTRGSVDPTQGLRTWYTNDDDQMICQICKEEMPFRKRDGEYYFAKVEALSPIYFPKEHEAQFLALCPLCEAMYKEFVKNDELAMEYLSLALRTSQEFEIPLDLGDVKTSLLLVEAHWRDIRTILGQRSPETTADELA
jgi:hypothetical protein